MSNVRYFLARRGEIGGPFEEAQVIAWFTAGVTDAQIQPEHGGDWIPITLAPFVLALPSPQPADSQEPAGPARALPAVAASAPGPKGASLSGFVLGMLHAIRWACAAFLATTFSLGLVALLCVRAPFGAMDSREFWVALVSRSEVVRKAHVEVDHVLDATERLLGERTLASTLLGDPQAMRKTFARVRPQIHDLISGETVDAVVGMMSGRDDEFRMNLGQQSLKDRLTALIARTFEEEHCRPGGGNAVGCIAGTAALQAGALDGLFNALSPQLGRLNPFSARSLSLAIPAVGVTRSAFRAMRVALALAPLMLGALAVLVLLTSLRLRTAAFMFGVAFLFAGGATKLAGQASHSAAVLAGMPADVWALAVQKSGNLALGVGVDFWVIAVGILLLVVRLAGPSWRRSFWKRRLASADPRISQLASTRLSSPAGLLEPWHVITAPKPDGSR